MENKEINIAIAKKSGFSVFTPKIILSEYFPNYGYSIKNHQEVDKEICYMLAKSGIHKDYWGGRKVVTFLLKDGLICVSSVTRKNELIAPGKNIPPFMRSEIPVHINRDFIRKEEHKNGFQLDDFAEYLPDYCSDANATQDIIDSFTRKQTISYISHLYDIVGGTMDDAVVASRKDKALAIWKTLKEEYERTKI